MLHDYSQRATDNGYYSSLKLHFAFRATISYEFQLSTIQQQLRCSQLEL